MMQIDGKVSQLVGLVVLALMVLLFVPCQGVVHAQIGDELISEEEQEAPDTSAAVAAKGFYFSIYWMVYFILTTAIWLALVAWVNKDTQRVSENSQLWCGMLLAVGFAHFLFPWVLPAPLLLGVAIGAVVFTGVLSWYIVLRNSRVPQPEKVLTAKHLSRVFRYTLSRAGIRLPVPQQDLRITVKGHIPVTFTDREGQPVTAFAEGTPQADALLMVQDMLAEAVGGRATAIQLEPKTEEIVSMYRIDTIMHPFGRFSKEVGGNLSRALRDIAGMSEPPQGKVVAGTLTAELPTLGKTVKLNIATTTTSAGERMLIRMTEPERELIALDGLGMANDVFAFAKAVVDGNRGALVVSTPRGTGQSTTLYAFLKAIDIYRRSVITLESALLRELPNISQVVVGAETGNVVSTLQTSLREEPDVVMVSDLVDREMTEIMLEAARGNKLFLAGLEAKNATAGLLKLVEMKVSKGLLASSLLGILSQRLVRVLCPQCKQAYRPSEEVRRKLKLPAKVEALYRASGKLVTDRGDEVRCQACVGTGYRGMTGVFEFVKIDDAIKTALRKDASVEELAAAARKQTTVGLDQAALAKVVQGITSLKEVSRAFKRTS